MAKALSEAQTAARVLRLVLEEDVVLVREHDEEVPLRASLPLAVGQALGLDRDACGDNEIQIDLRPSTARAPE